MAGPATAPLLVLLQRWSPADAVRLHRAELVAVLEPSEGVAPLAAGRASVFVAPGGLMGPACRVWRSGRGQALVLSVPGEVGAADAAAALVDGRAPDPWVLVAAADRAALAGCDPAVLGALVGTARTVLVAGCGSAVPRGTLRVALGRPVVVDLGPQGPLAREGW